MINGKGFKWFVDNFFEKFLLSNIDEENISMINNSIKHNVHKSNAMENAITPVINEKNANANETFPTMHQIQDFKMFFMKDG